MPLSVENYAKSNFKHVPTDGVVCALNESEQSRFQSFVPLDKRSENDSSGSIHFEITIGTAGLKYRSQVTGCRLQVTGYRPQVKAKILVNLR